MFPELRLKFILDFAVKFYLKDGGVILEQFCQTMELKVLCLLKNLEKVEVKFVEAQETS